VFPDGSYYRGKFKDNQAQGPNGEFQSKEYEYIGDFKNNAFDGNGE